MMMAQSGDIFVLEVNTIPGMTERSLLPKAALVTGLRFNALCVKILEDFIAQPTVFPSLYFEWQVPCSAWLLL